MNAKKIVFILLLIVILVGLMVIAGWIFDIDALKSIIPSWVTMKFTTALCFVLSAISLHYIAKIFEDEIDVAFVVLSLTTYIILLVMFSLLVSTIVGVKTGIEDFFVKEPDGAIFTIIAGRPSIGTMLCFICISLSSIIAMLNIRLARKCLPFIGFIIIAFGSSALLGYVINQPIFYFVWAEFSTGMAFHTAILFVLLGISLNQLVIVNEKK